MHVSTSGLSNKCTRSSKGLKKKIVLVGVRAPPHNALTSLLQEICGSNTKDMESQKCAVDKDIRTSRDGVHKYRK